MGDKSEQQQSCRVL